MSHPASEFRNSNQTRNRNSKSLIPRCKLILLRWLSPLQHLTSSNKPELPKKDGRWKRLSFAEMVDDLSSENPTTRAWALWKTRQLMMDFPNRIMFNVIRIKTLPNRNWRLETALASVILKFEHPIAAFGSEFTPILVAQLSYPDPETIRYVFDGWFLKVGWRHRELDCLIKLSVIKSIVNQTNPNTSVTALRRLAKLTPNLFCTGGTLRQDFVYEELVPAFKYLIKQTDTEVLFRTTWAVGCFAHLVNRQRRLLINARILHQLIPFISHPYSDVAFCAIHAVRYFTSDSNEQRQAVWHCGFLNHFPSIPRTIYGYSCEFALLSLSDLAAGNRELLCALVEWGLFPRIRNCADYEDIPALTACDLMKYGNCKEVPSVIHRGLINILRLRHYTTDVTLHILSKLLSNAGGQLEQVKKRIEDGYSMEEVGELQWSVNDDESRLSYHIIEDYFG